MVGRPEGKRPFGRPRRRWEGNIKMDLQEVRWGGRDWISVTQVSIKCCEFLDYPRTG